MKTKTNLELKHLCDDFGHIKAVLKEIGAKKEVIKKQKDYFFNLPQTKGIQARLKIRIENQQQTAVYYKRPDFEHNKSTVAEVALYSIPDKQLLPFLQKILGVFAIVEKIREVWRKNNTIFNLDKVRHVGKVFEIELQKRGKITKKDETVFKDYQKRLMPYLGKVVKGSNADLVAQNRK